MKTAKQFKAEYDRQAREIPTEKKREFIESMRAGKTLGESARAIGVDEIMVAASLFIQCHETVHILKPTDQII